MYSKTRNVFYFSILLIASDARSDANEASSQALQLFATPNKCVALREGRTCYADIEMSWQAPLQGNYCLQKVNEKTFIQCWQNRQTGSVSYQFNAKQTVNFQLVDISTGQALYTAPVEVSWVYKNKQKKRRWRLF